MAGHRRQARLLSPWAVVRGHRNEFKSADCHLESFDLGGQLSHPLILSLSVSCSLVCLNKLLCQTESISPLLVQSPPAILTIQNCFGIQQSLIGERPDRGTLSMESQGSTVRGYRTEVSSHTHSGMYHQRK